uniref:Conotoxin superfamily S n=1 Tax=Conus magus TaxID=6492 RepID=A0A5P8I0V1_CONMA|nr:conotoxin superfamily S [Conus magus]
MMSKMGAMFVLLLLFTLASSQQEGDVQARKIRLRNDFLRTSRMIFTRGCGGSCHTTPGCGGNCECNSPVPCYCSGTETCVCVCSG